MYPKRKDRFVTWAKSMVEGATIGSPAVTSKGHSRTGSAKRTKRRKRRRKKKTDAKE